MPPQRTLSHRLNQKPTFSKPTKTERTHEENQERAYIAASRRSDRSLEARIESARRASEIHKKRTGRALRVTEQDVLNEEMYEEEDDEPAHSHRYIQQMVNGTVPPADKRFLLYYDHQIQMAKLFERNVFPNGQVRYPPGYMGPQQSIQPYQYSQPVNLFDPAFQRNSIRMQTFPAFAPPLGQSQGRALSTHIPENQLSYAQPAVTTMPYLNAGLQPMQNYAFYPGDQVGYRATPPETPPQLLLEEPLTESPRAASPQSASPQIKSSPRQQCSPQQESPHPETPIQEPLLPRDPPPGTKLSLEELSQGCDVLGPGFTDLALAGQPETGLDPSYFDPYGGGPFDFHFAGDLTEEWNGGYMY